jgi:hypothetical protein
MNATAKTFGSPSGEPSTTRSMLQQMCEKLWTLPVSSPLHHHHHQLNYQGVYLPARDLVEAYRCAERARDVLDAVACHILAEYEAEDAAASKAVLQTTRLKQKIGEVYPIHHNGPARISWMGSC